MHHVALNANQAKSPFLTEMKLCSKPVIDILIFLIALLVVVVVVVEVLNKVCYCVIPQVEENKKHLLCQ